jgi:hypothetical protein
MNNVYIVETETSFGIEMIGIYTNPTLAVEKAENNKKISNCESWVYEYTLNDKEEYVFTYEFYNKNGYQMPIT